LFPIFREVKVLEAGIVWVNYMRPAFVEAAWGDYRRGGIERE
jgi:hypothetical protein